MTFHIARFRNTVNRDVVFYSNKSFVLLNCFTVILGPRSSVVEVSILLGYVATLLGNLFSTVRDKAIVPYSKVEIFQKNFYWQ